MTTRKADARAARLRDPLAIGLRSAMLLVFEGDLLSPSADGATIHLRPEGSSRPGVRYANIVVIGIWRASSRAHPGA